MAKLFLSYSRKDEAKARRFTDWLEREGHDVWRDEEDIGGGASFSSEIEKALKDCDAVLVLWSAQSVQSAWVRDEAAFGRDAGKLIPLTLDGTEPPLGFRQFQAIHLLKWRGRGLPSGADRIRSSIDRVTGAAPAASSSSCTAIHPRVERRFGRLSITSAAAVIVVLLAVAAVFGWHRWSANDQIAIAVLASPRSSDRAMAADYANVAAAEMAAFLPRRFDRATVIAPADAGGQTSGYRMEISTDPHSAGANATVTLSDQDGRTTLWSKNWTVADANGSDLKAQVSTAASKAALCLTDARGGSTRLSQPALGLFISGCVSLGEEVESDKDMGTIFERVTKLAPGFGPGWSYLALTRSWTAEQLRGGSPAAYAAALQSARDAIAVARKLNPSNAMSYDAEYHLNSNDTFRGLQILEKGAKIDPDDGRIQMHLSEEYMFVGRLLDSVQAAQRGAELEPSSTYTRSQYILALVYSGEFSKAKADIADARRKWPSDPNIDWAEYGFQYRYGDPKAAEQLMPKVLDYSDAAMVPQRKLLAARLDPSPAKIDDAISAFRVLPGTGPDRENQLLLALGTFHKTDYAYQLLDDARFQPFIETSVLFRPEFVAVRADPRFMAVAARLGLVTYWRKSGTWPDFCTSERLKYDCKTEAAKYPG